MSVLGECVSECWVVLPQHSLTHPPTTLDVLFGLGNRCFFLWLGGLGFGNVYTTPDYEIHAIHFVSFRSVYPCMVFGNKSSIIYVIYHAG